MSKTVLLILILGTVITIFVDSILRIDFSGTAWYARLIHVGMYMSFGAILGYAILKHLARKFYAKIKKYSPDTKFTEGISFEEQIKRADEVYEKIVKPQIEEEKRLRDK